MDPTVALAMQQGFAQSHAALTHAGIRHNNDMNFVTVTTQLQHGLDRQAVGAHAMGRLDMDALSKSILDQRSASGQPQAKPA